MPDVSIWEAEFGEHRVPPVCMKSGAPAAGTWTSLFLWSPGGALRVRLPLADSWLGLFTALMITRTVGLAIAVPCYALYYLVADMPRVVRFYGLTAVVIGGIAATVLWYALPRGRVHRLPTGERWVHLTGAHPMFINAMNRARLAGPSVFSRDGLWYWDGSRWTSNKLPEQWWRRFFTGFERLRGWQVTLLVLLAWVVIAVVAWARYHS